MSHKEKQRGLLARLHDYDLRLGLACGVICHNELGSEEMGRGWLSSIRRCMAQRSSSWAGAQGQFIKHA